MITNRLASLAVFMAAGVFAVGYWAGWSLQGQTTNGTAPIVINDGGAGYATTGAWTRLTAGNSGKGSAYMAGYWNDLSYVNRRTATAPQATASWTFQNLQPGTYEVQVIWPYFGSSVQTTASSYAVKAQQEQTFPVSQNQNLNALPANKVAADGRFRWLKLGSFSPKNGTITVTLTAGVGLTSADAARLVRAGDATQTPVPPPQQPAQPTTPPAPPQQNPAPGTAPQPSSVAPATGASVFPSYQDQCSQGGPGKMGLLMSMDGLVLGYTAFDGSSQNVNATSKVFLYDVGTKQIQQFGTPSAYNILQGMSPNGRFILVREGPAGKVYDRMANTSTTIEKPVGLGSITDDGRYVAYQDLTQWMTNSSNPPRVALLDRETNTTKQVTSSSNIGARPAVSADGRYVAFAPLPPPSQYQPSTIQLFDANTNLVTDTKRSVGINYGRSEIRFMPTGTQPNVLGYAEPVSADGRVRIYAIPSPAAEPRKALSTTVAGYASVEWRRSWTHQFLDQSMPQSPEGLAAKYTYAYTYMAPGTNTVDGSSYGINYTPLETTLSGNGRKAAYVLARGDVRSGNKVTNVYYYDRDTKAQSLVASAPAGCKFAPARPSQWSAAMLETILPK